MITLNQAFLQFKHMKMITLNQAFHQFKHMKMITLNQAFLQFKHMKMITLNQAHEDDHIKSSLSSIQAHEDNHIKSSLSLIQAHEDDHIKSSFSLIQAYADIYTKVKENYYYLLDSQQWQGVRPLTIISVMRYESQEDQELADIHGWASCLMPFLTRRFVPQAIPMVFHHLYDRLKGTINKR